MFSEKTITLLYIIKYSQIDWVNLNNVACLVENEMQTREYFNANIAVFYTFSGINSCASIFAFIY